jgi:4-aminobutyrate aminotransferase-like enzyme
LENNELLQRRNRYLGTGAALFYKEPIQIVRGEGVSLFDQNGVRYIDMYNNVPCVGHAHPHVVQAMQRQASTLNVHSRYLHEGIVNFAERLTGLHHDGIESAIFACSGTEANDIAMTMAKLATGNSGFISTNAAYHGNSQQVMQLTHVPLERSVHGNVCAFEFPDSLRRKSELVSESDFLEACLDSVRTAIAKLHSAEVGLAGLLICPIMANEGLPNIPAGFMRAATQLVHDAGGLVISDEVQAGYCRTGQWWGYDLSGFVPDIVTMGKPMGNGLPLSACAASRSLVEKFRAKTRYFNTFASSPLQAATGMAVIDVIEDEDLAKNASAVGAYLQGALSKMAGQSDHLAEVRGCGLFVGLEWVTDKSSNTPDKEGAIAVVNALQARGFLTSNAGAHANVIKIRPPLVFQREHADEFLAAFSDILKNG